MIAQLVLKVCVSLVQVWFDLKLRSVSDLLTFIFSYIYIDYEMTFLRIVEAITNGSFIQINYTGTVVRYKPGLIIGGTHSFKVPKSRGMGYFLEPLLLLAPFGKKPLTVTLTDGITSVPSITISEEKKSSEIKHLPVQGTGDVGVDTIRISLFSILKKFGIDREELRITTRGAAPGGGGDVQLHMPHQVLQPTTLHVTSSPSIDRIRGIAYSTRVSPASVNRIVEAARDVLRPTNCDTHIYTDVAQGKESGASPGFGVTLVAETKDGWAYGVECVARPGEQPEDMGAQAAAKLLEEIELGGAVARGPALQLAIVLMVLGKEDIGRIILGKKAIDAKFIRLLRTLKQFFGVEAILKDEDPDSEVIMCLIKGVGFINSNKKIA